MKEKAGKASKERSSLFSFFLFFPFFFKKFYRFFFGFPHKGRGEWCDDYEMVVGGCIKSDAGGRGLVAVAVCGGGALQLGVIKTGRPK